MPACPACAQENPEIARFCLACGVRLAPPDEGHEERRVVTVLFADLVGFTGMSEQLDPEDVRGILSVYYERVRRDIESFGGVVEKFIGDAVMGLFGAPVSYGDDPERAVRAALAVRDSVSALKSGVALHARVAVNTGEALVTLRPEQGQAMVAGDVVNTASRLQQAASVDSVLVGAETYVCTRDVIRYEEVPPVLAKGKSLPVAAWQALAATCSPGEARGGGAPFVGRRRDLHLLAGTWDRVVADRTPHLVTVLAPSGVGKTRLAAEFTGSLPATGGRTVAGRSTPYRESGAYGAFASQVKRVCGIFESDPAEVALAKLQETVSRWVLGADCGSVTEHLGVLLGFEALHGISDRESLFFSVRCFIEAVATDQPLLLVFEDAHWADAELLDLVEFLAARLRSLPVLVLVLARPELLDARTGWGAPVPSHLTLTLEPLGEQDSQELAGHLLGSLSDSERVTEAARLTATAEGNPLFLEQLAATLTERALGSATSSLPTTIRGIVTARLDALPADERSVLMDAAVAGRVFWRGVLTGTTAEGSLGRVLGALEARDLIHRERNSMIEGDQQFAFKHGLIRDVAYETLPRRRRRERHAEVAQYLEQAVSPGAEAAASMARHWREAGRLDRAAHYFAIAADQAGRGWAKHRAVALYGDALACLPADDVSGRRDILRRQAVAWQAAVHIRDARQLGREERAVAGEAVP